MRTELIQRIRTGIPVDWSDVPNCNSFIYTTGNNKQRNDVKQSLNLNK